MRRRNRPDVRHCASGELPMDIIVTVPDATNLDGAIAELYEAGGHLHAEIRIPAPETTDAPMRV